MSKKQLKEFLDDIPQGRCRYCKKMIVIVTATGRLARHNVGWHPEVNGVSLPIRCEKGSGSKPEKVS